MDMSVIEDRKARARSWFERLRDNICSAFEKLEDDAPASLYPGDAGRFERTSWDRTDHTGQPGGGGGRPALLGVGHFADRAYAQPERPRRAYEHPFRGHDQGVVRRRRGSDAG